MKKTLLILFAISALFAVATANPVLLVASLVGVGMSTASYKDFKKNPAFFTLVPSIVRDMGSVQRTADGSFPEVPPFTHSQKFLFDFLRQKSNLVTLDAFLKETIFFDPINYYVRYVIPGAQQGRYQILGAFTQQIVGATNFYTQAILPQYYNFCFDRMQINYGSTNTANAAVQAISGWTNVRSSMPAALANGDIIVQLNKNIIVQTGVVDFTSEAAITGGNSLDYAGGALQVPRVLQENLLIEADLNFAFQQAIPNVANTTYGVEVLFKGIQLRLR